MNDLPAYDVIVVGAGGSGLATAVSAAEQGGRVLVLERNRQPGGTTGIAVGSFTAAGTELQRADGIADNAQDHALDVSKFAPPELEARNNHALREFFLSEAAATLAWIQGFGLRFVGPHPEPPNRQPRMHNVVPGAKAYIAGLQMALLRRHGEILCDAEVTRLLRDETHVIGVEVRRNGDLCRFRARRGVVLAGGDYSNNPDLIARHKGERFQTIEGINPHATGTGHRLAEEAGAELVNMDVTYGPELRFVPASRRPFQQWLPAAGWRARIMAAIARRLPAWVVRRLIKRLLVTWQHPENALFDHGAILLNRLGERFVDERQWPEREIAVSKQPEKSVFLLLDRRLVAMYSQWPHFISTAPDIAYAYVADYLRLRPDVTVQGGLAEVCAARGLDSDVVQRTLHADDRQPGLDANLGGPFVLLGPLKAYFTTTEGGAAVNQQLQVLGRDGQVIRGLYAVGQNGIGGMILWSHGLHIAWALTSGRLAGRAVMQQSPRTGGNPV